MGNTAKQRNPCWKTSNRILCESDKKNIENSQFDAKNQSSYIFLYNDKNRVNNQQQCKQRVFLTILPPTFLQTPLHCAAPSISICATVQCWFMPRRLCIHSSSQLELHWPSNTTNITIDEHRQLGSPVTSRVQMLAKDFKPTNGWRDASTTCKQCDLW